MYTNLYIFATKKKKTWKLPQVKLYTTQKYELPLSCPKISES